MEVIKIASQIVDAKHTIDTNLQQYLHDSGHKTIYVRRHELRDQITNHLKTRYNMTNKILAKYLLISQFVDEYNRPSACHTAHVLNTDERVLLRSGAYIKVTRDTIPTTIPKLDANKALHFTEMYY